MNGSFAYCELTGECLHDQLSLRRHVPLTAFYRLVKALFAILKNMRKTTESVPQGETVRVGRSAT